MKLKYGFLGFSLGLAFLSLQAAVSKTTDLNPVIGEEVCQLASVWKLATALGFTYRSY